MKDLILQVSQMEELPAVVSRDIEVVYVLRGEITLLLGESHYQMKAEDVIVVNSGAERGWKNGQGCLLVRIRIRYGSVTKMTGRPYVKFWCNSVINGGHDVAGLRVLLRSFVRQYAANNGRDSYSLEGAKNLFLDNLTRHFLLSEEASWTQIDDIRVQQILQDVNEHYEQELSLSELSKKYYLSETYLSRLFKNNTGMNFRDYLINLRLDNAAENLLYSEKSVQDIALECGFSTSSVFNRIFRKKYNCTPTVYRHNNRKDLFYTGGDSASGMEELAAWLQKGDRLHKSQATASEEDGKEVLISPDGQQRVNLQQFALNFGTFYDLLQSKVQTQLESFVMESDCSIIRLAGIFMRELHMRTGRGSNAYNFFLIDQGLDFLVKRRITPLIDLTITIKNPVSDVLVGLFEDEDWMPFVDLTDYGVMVEALFRHLVDRYGEKLVSTWLFELDESDVYRAYAKKHRLMEIPYEEFWKRTVHALRSICCDARIGGEKGLLSMTISSEEKPDFIADKAFPYDMHTTEDDVYVVRNTEFFFLENQLERVRHEAVRQQADFPVVLTEWGTSMSERNAYNDSPGKAAHVAAHLARLAGKPGMAFYCQGSDYFSQYLDTALPFVGGNGILTRDGIRKPVYFVFSFLNRSRGRILHEDQNSLVIYGDNGHYRILLFHAVDFGHEYFLHPESKITNDLLQDIYSDGSEKQVCLELQGLKETVYRIHKDLLSEQYGNALQVWIDMGRPEKIRQEEVDYIQAVSRPQMTIRYEQVREGKLTIRQVLKPNEVVMLDISPI